MEKEGISLPEDVLHRVSAVSPEGFFLFYMGSDGEPEYISTADNSVFGRAIVSFLEESLEKKSFEDKKKSEVFKDNLLLGKLEEHSAGGFLLIFVAEGDVDYILDCDNKIIKRGLLSFTKDIVAGLRFKEQSEYAGHFVNGDREDDSDTED